MKRRSFFAGFAGLCGVAAILPAAKAEAATRRVLGYELICATCNLVFKDEVDLDQLIAKAMPQCCSCLSVLPFPDDLAKRILAAQKGRNA